jgi:hypothetical protein
LISLKGSLMLAEFLFTPDVLADENEGNGVGLVREIKQCLLPSRAVPVALVCKLGEEWEKATSRKIARIENSNHRQDAMTLFQTLLSQLCVTRPGIPLVSNDEAGWIAAGVTSSSHVSIDRIIVSTKSSQTVGLGVSVKEFIADAFWEPFENPRLVGRDTATQERVLRTICTHSDWLTLRLPQIRGGSDDEIVTVKQIIKLSSQLPVGFRKTAIDLHICMHPRISEQNLTRGVSNELAVFVRQGIRIRLTIWPERHFVNRELLAGEFAKKSSGELIARPLWWITMTHVAVGSLAAANAGEAGNTWSLFSRSKSHDRFTQINAEHPVRSEMLR